MRDRLEKFIRMEGLTPSRFAEIMGVQPSSISHILGGRNKPSFDFLEKMLLRFPKINPDWLLLGKGSVYRTTDTGNSESLPMVSKENSQPQQQAIAPGTLPFESPAVSTQTNTATSSSEKIQGPSSHLPSDQSADNTPPRDESSSPSRPAIPSNVSPAASFSKAVEQLADDEIESIVVFLKNKTFISYRPK